MHSVSAKIMILPNLEGDASGKFCRITLDSEIKMIRMMHKVNRRKMFATSNVFQIRSTITNSLFGKDNEELFDISIIRLSDFADSTDSLKSQITAQSPDYVFDHFLKVNSETSNNETISKTIFDGLKNKGLFSSPFNIINVTPEKNCADIGVSPKDASVSLSNSAQTLSVYSLDGPTISTRFGISTLNDLWYAGVPVLEKIDSLSIAIQIPNPNQTKAIKVYCYNGEDFIPSTQISSTQITKEGPNNIVIALSNLIPKNYYTYASSYAVGTAITTPLVNQSFWKFIEPKNVLIVSTEVNPGGVKFGAIIRTTI